MADPSLTLEQVRATAAGKQPTLEELQSMVDHAINHAADLVALLGAPGAPVTGWPSPLDSRNVLPETNGIANDYEIAINDSTGNGLFEGMRVWIYGISLTNTGASRLLVGSTDGYLPIRKKTLKGVVELVKGDMPKRMAHLYYSAAESAWLLQNPTSSGAGMYTVAEIPTNASLYNEGDYIFVVE